MPIDIQKILRSPIFTPHRLIHAPPFHNKTPRLVIVGNNTMLFAAVDALSHHGRDKYPPITFFYPPFWLDSVHRDNMDFDWGQTAYGLPRMVRKRFLSIHPGYSEEKRILWKEFQALRMHALDELAKYRNVELHMCQPETITPFEDQWKISTGKQDLFVPKQSFFYWWFRKPKKVDRLSHSHTLLYQMPRILVPSHAIIIGHGPALAWVLKHFKDLVVINVKRPDSTLPDIPINKDIDLKEEIKRGRLKLYNTNEYRVVTDPSGTLGNILKIATNEVEFLHGTPIFSAAGMYSDHSICSVIPRDQIVILPELDHHGRPVINPDAKTKALLDDIFIAPKNVRVPGSLPHGYPFIMSVTDNTEWTAEPMVYYGTNHAQRIKDAAKSIGISLSMRYFEKIDDTIISMSDPLSLDSAIAMYIRVCKEMCDVTDIDIKKFEQCLLSMFQDRQLSEQLDMPKKHKPGGL